MRTTRLLLTVLALPALACAARQQPAPRPDDMSAADHRREAARERDEADRHVAAYSPEATHDVRPMGPVDDPSDTYIYGVTVYNPTEHHLTQAEQHRKHALEHETAAAELEQFTDEECGQLPPASRVACPLLTGVVRIDDIAGGARVTFAPDVNVAAVGAHMRCHAAWARAEGNPADATCPLYRKGLKVNVAPEQKAIDVTIGDRDMVPMIRKQLRRESVPATAPTT